MLQHRPDCRWLSDNVRVRIGTPAGGSCQMSNLDHAVVEGFGQEWSRFDQSGIAQAELQALFNEYFSVFPWADLPPGAVGFDLGCGSGRWAQFVAPRVGQLHCIDASSAALEV